MQNDKTTIQDDVKDMERHDIWRKNCRSQTLKDELKSYLEQGLIYVGGRDQCFRPSIILQTALINKYNLSSDD